ncbi:Amuc_1100 family pilus-like protein [Luteolibacter ambystomatis]|uniref:Amuc_1100 family pilus-like protein n=1 Tax=Luteolibacter ambystomatis TaxID=2824561 RepID=A0A975G5T5_9BACT|nr:Amuc_1100 family pilus-like protein [Luteolibacter ambystomatis]QUE49629.1 Amuc_1100 family pilus-like protein [Luteolibacter ambystomatis]
MSWIKENPFVAGLGGVTIVGAGALLFLGSHFSGKYQKAQDSYTEDASAVAAAEKLTLYPAKENARGKDVAIKEYKEELGKLQESFNKFRPAEVKNISPQDFTNNVKASSDKVHEAFAASKATLPESFFVGFENYKSTLAPESATGILNYELGALTEVFMALAKAAPQELVNVHRQALAEEAGGVFSDKDAAVRPLSFEITFRGGEKSVRDFFTALSASPDNYYVIRTIRVENEKQVGPVPADAKFETPKAAGAGAAANPFAGFDLGEGAAPAGDAKKPKADTSKILQQVLGQENVTVFVRVDLMRFLAAKDTSKL